jgi:nitrile hydratase accessory protein
MTTHPKNHVRSLTERLPFRDRIPRREGEMAFDQPWEIRALSMTVALHDQGELTWPEFQRELITAIRQWEESPASTDEWHYYERWLVALEEVLAAHGLVPPDELDRRASEVLATPPDREHQHAHPEPLAVCRLDHDH